MIDSITIRQIKFLRRHKVIVDDQFKQTTTNVYETGYSTMVLQSEGDRELNINCFRVATITMISGLGL